MIRFYNGASYVEILPTLFFDEPFFIWGLSKLLSGSEGEKDLPYGEKDLPIPLP